MPVHQPCIAHNSICKERQVPQYECSSINNGSKQNIINMFLLQLNSIQKVTQDLSSNMEHLHVRFG